MADANTIFIISFLVIAIGALLRRMGVLRDQDGQILARVALNVTLPAVVLCTVPTIPMDPSLALIPLVCLVHCGIVLGIGCRLFRGEEDRTRAVLLLASAGSNNALFAFPIVEAIWGARGLQYPCSTLIILGVDYLIASWYGSRASGGSPRLTLRFVGLNRKLASVATNVSLLASFLLMWAVAALL